jgi:uncharacterized repeat protein (TIGR03803 family)
MLSLRAQNRAAIVLAGSLVVALTVGVQAQAAEHVLYAFQGGSDGAGAGSTPIVDSAGNLFATTFGGGGSGCQDGAGCGTAFELSENGTETVLHAFTGGDDGGYPAADLLLDATGNLYGATNTGGRRGGGVVFQLASDGTESILYAFKGGADGVQPTGIYRDKKGTIFGTTVYGGNGNVGVCGSNGCGTVFEIKPNGNETVLHAFQGGNDGIYPVGGLVRDKAGNLYGASDNGGGGGGCANGAFGCGTIFRIAQDGTESVLYAFQGGNDGYGPTGNLIIDSEGNLYGTTISGGGSNCGTGCGTIFKVAPEGTETILHAFQGGSDGSTPLSGLSMDRAGNLYGATFYGGGPGCKGAGCGTVYELMPDGNEIVLHVFKKLVQGRGPGTALLVGKNRILYGMAGGGIDNDGVVFSVKAK